jgi:hypothetical protein
VLIFEWYQQRVFDTAMSDEVQVYTPHVTRATLFPEDDFDRELWHMRRLVMPGLLVPILRNCAHREEVFRYVGDLIANTRLDGFRQEFGAALESRNDEALARLRRMVERDLEEFGPSRAANVIGRIGVNVLVGYAEVETPITNAALLAIRPFSYQELLDAAIRVFPELGPAGGP